jgi:hypothetical protein
MGTNQGLRTTVTLDAGVKAAYESLHATRADLSLSDFINEACRFYLRYQGEPALGPMTAHLATIRQQLQKLIDQERPTARMSLAGVAPTIATAVIDGVKPMLEEVIRDATAPPIAPEPQHTWWKFWRRR